MPKSKKIKKSSKKSKPKKTKAKKISKPKPKVSEKELLSFLGELVGKDGLRVVEQLRKRKNVSEFTLAEKLGMSINQFRHVIYKLDELNLVSSTRKKDKKKGWYVYYWTFHNDRLVDLYYSYKLKRLKKLKEKLEQGEKETYFVCPSGCYRFKIEEAMEHGYRCPECGAVLQEEKVDIKKLKKEIEKLEKELKEAGRL